MPGPQLHRRKLLLGAALAAAIPPRAWAQTKVPRVGILSGLSRDKSQFTPLILKELAGRGYHEGKNMRLEFHSADGDVSRYPELAKQLAAAKCDVIIAIANSHSGRALKAATATTPVVLLASEYDPVETGIVASLARPGGNITGVFTPARPLLAKNLELAREVLPGAERFLVLSDPVAEDQLPDLRKVARESGASLTVVEYRKPPYALAEAFDAGRKAKVQATIVPLSPIFSTMRPELSRLIVDSRVPAFVPFFMVGDAGSLASYGVDFAAIVKRGVAVTDRILKGARPGEIPIEHVAEYRLIVNMKTAKALGLKVPYSVLARAASLVE